MSRSEQSLIVGLTSERDELRQILEDVRRASDFGDPLSVTRTISQHIGAQLLNFDLRVLKRVTGFYA